MTRQKTVGLMADPGVAEKVADRVSEGLAHRLSENTEEHWVVETVQEQLPLDSEGMINLSDYAPEILEKYQWDYVFYLTDLPIFYERQPVLCRTVAQDHGALIVLPALGAFRLRSQVAELVITLLQKLSGTTDEIDTAAVSRDIKRKVKLVGTESPLILLRGPFNQFRMLTGMVRGNRPIQLPGAMSGFMTAGAATGAFGIFYSSIWALADALYPGRLLLIGAIIVALLTTWLIMRNGLWNTRHITQARLDNIATVITVGIGVTLSYLMLFVGLLALSTVIVDAGYLSSQLEKSAGPRDYLELSWLAASLGTMAGALGANFDSDDAIRQATYSKRWHERREMFNTYEKSAEEEEEEQEEDAKDERNEENEERNDS